MEADWKKIRKEYIKGGTSQRQLAAKYGVSVNTIKKKCKAEGWVKLRSQKDSKCTAKTVDKLAEQEARVDTAVYDAANELLAKFRASVSAVDSADPGMLKDWGSALRSIQLVLSSEPTELDIRKKEAEIAKLMRDAAGDQVDNDIEIVLPPEIMED